MRRPHAFTLVELLVVIGIIALLISILMPALRKARESAQNVACVSNIRQMSMALIMYTGDNDYWIPPIRPNHSYDYGGWLYVLAPYLNAVPPYDPAFAATQDTPFDSRDLAPNTALYCPVQATGFYSTLLGYSAPGKWRYSMNHDLRFEQKITQIKGPADTFAFTENSYYYDVIHPPFLEYAFFGHPTPGIAGPSHGGRGISIAYLDGHAEFWSGKPTRANYRFDPGFPWTHSRFWGWPYSTRPPTAAQMGTSPVDKYFAARRAALFP